MKIDAIDMPYKALNEKVRALAAAGEKSIELDHICGQKFIGDGLKGHVKIDIKGIPGNDLAVFMDGPEITVHGNGQDGIGNTMNAGKVVVHGNAGDVIGYAMRGGKIFVKGDVGYRVDPQPWSFAARQAAVKQIDVRRNIGKDRIEGIVQNLQPRPLGVAQIDDHTRTFGRLDTRLVYSVFQRRVRHTLGPRSGLTPSAPHTRTFPKADDTPKRTGAESSHSKRDANLLVSRADVRTLHA